MARPKCPRTGKDKFPNALECELAIVSIQGNNIRHRRRKFREEPTRSYPCEFCGSHHMTSRS